MKLWLERLLLTAGVIGIGWWAGGSVLPLAWQRWENWTFERRAANADERAAMPRKRDLIGRLAIPRLQLSVIVREGTDSTTLALSAGHIPGTALPGQRGNIGIAAHRDTLFRALENIAPHDIVRLDGA